MHKNAKMFGKTRAPRGSCLPLFQSSCLSEAKSKASEAKSKAFNRVSSTGRAGCAGCASRAGRATSCK